MPDAAICFLATSKSGLGHLRRSATIARRIRDIAPDRALHLVTNAPPAGIPPAEMAAFDSLRVVDRARMAGAVPAEGRTVLVLDTITVPGVEALGAPLALVLREAPDAQLHRFRLAAGRPWDLVIIANPRDHWMPPEDALAARALAPVGWIYRSAGLRQRPGAAVPQVLLATGGGGTEETARLLHAEVDALIEGARQRSSRPFEVIQAVGPRAAHLGRLVGADRIVDPGPRLHDLFRDADIVISTAGYNSVLELATTDTPALLVPIARSIDDQVARARLWGPRLGCWHEASAPGTSAEWLARQVERRLRRPPVELGASGEDAAARAILGLG